MTKVKISTAAIACTAWVVMPVCIAWYLGASPIFCLLLIGALCTLHFYIIIKHSSRCIGTLGLMLDALLDDDRKAMEAARLDGLDHNIDVYKVLGRTSDGKKRW